MAPGLPAAGDVSQPTPQESLAARLNTKEYGNTLTFAVNGTMIRLTNPDPHCTLLEYLRSIGLTGTKLGCGEGGCGESARTQSTHTDTCRGVHGDGIHIQPGDLCGQKRRC